MTVVQGDPFDAADIRVSSSKVRKLLAAGDVEKAAHCLGRPYQLEGLVVSGEHIGTALGFPTANLQLSDADKLVPAAGAYAVKVRLEGSPEELHGMMNIGHRPTFGGEHQTLETHILHFSGNVYGRKMVVWFISRLRPEQKFDSREALTAQLAHDADIFVVIGTSLVVYPAAALIQYVKRGVPIYYIDPKPAAVPDWVTVIQKPATQGVADLINILRS